MRTEEDVKVHHLLPLLELHGYKTEQCRFEVAVEVQEGRRIKRIYADVVVYADRAKQTPILLCETKSPSEPLSKFVRDQAISYARLLPKIAPICLITNGLQTQVYQTLTKTRLDSLPTKAQFQGDVVRFTISRELQDALRAEAKHELFVIDDVDTFKVLLKACHNEIRNNEGYDPTVAFDEMSKLLFCKMHEERTDGKNRFRLNVFDTTLRDLGINVVRQIFAETTTDPSYRGLFQEGISINLQDRTIRSIVKLLENIDLSLTAFDVKGEAFEYFLSDTFTGGLGEFFTPRNVVEFISDAVDPKIGEKIVDPFCGTGGFLMYAFEVVSEKIRLQDFAEAEKAAWRYRLSNESLYGTDWKERTAQACKMNMTVHGDGSSGIYLHHGLKDVPGAIEPGLFSICLTNPPFGSSETDPDVLANYELGRSRNSQDRIVLGIERAVTLVQPGGRIGIVTIDGVLNNASMAYVRNYIRRHCLIRGVVSLNKETFEGYNARAKTSVLFLEKRPQTMHNLANAVEEQTFFAVASNTGYAANGAAVPGNELPDILSDYQEFLAGREPKLHARSRVASIDERLDAEYYVPASLASDTKFQETVTTLNEAANKLLADVQSFARESEADVTGSTTEYLISDILEPVKDKVFVMSEESYTTVGVRWWGGGTFAKDTKLGREISARYLYRIKGGDLIYNRLFAFRGSFALVSSEHDGLFVSNEFPSFSVKSGLNRDGEKILKFLVQILNSKQMLAEVDRLSTGSTKQSRNRFYEDKFLNLRVAIPDHSEVLDSAISCLTAAAELKRTSDELAKYIALVQNQLSSALYLQS